MPAIHISYISSVHACSIHVAKVINLCMYTYIRVHALIMQLKANSYMFHCN